QELEQLEQRRQDAINEVMASGADLEEAQDRVNQIEAQYLQDRKAIESRHAEETQVAQKSADGELAKGRSDIVDQIEQIHQETHRKIDEIESINWMALLNVAQYPDLK